MNIYVLQFCHGDTPQSTRRSVVYAGTNKEMCQGIADWCMNVICEARDSTDPNVSARARSAHVFMKTWTPTDTDFAMAELLELWRAT